MKNQKEKHDSKMNELTKIIKEQCEVAIIKLFSDIKKGKIKVKGLKKSGKHKVQ